MVMFTDPPRCIQLSAYVRSKLEQMSRRNWGKGLSANPKLVRK